MKKDRKTKHTIWSNYLDAVEAIQIDLMTCGDRRDDFIASNGLEDEDEKTIDEQFAEYCYDDALQYCEDYLDDERCNLDVNVGNTILAIGDLGLWHGRVHGYKEIKSGRISDCLYTDCDYAHWYCDAHDMRCEESHHDGTNYILYRRRKDGISDYQWDNFLYMIYEGKATREHISKYTTSLLPYIAKVYGWKYHGKEVA